MKTTFLLAGVAMLALTAGASASNVHPGLTMKSVPSHQIVKFTPRNASTDLYDQSAGSDSNAIVSDNFTSGDFGTAYNNAGADDFVLPAGNHTIDTVLANGEDYQADGYAPPTSFDVTFYKIKIGKKGTKVKTIVSCPGSTYTEVNSGGEDAIDVSSCAKKTKFKGGKDTYVSVVANMDFEAAYEWYWRTNVTQQNNPALWENPGGGFGVGCTTWSPMQGCLPYTGVGPDFAFAIYGN